MTQLHETAYPRLKAEPTAQDLEEVYTLTPEEVAFIDRATKRPTARTAAFLYLKLFQRLGYFIRLKDSRVRPNWQNCCSSTGLPVGNASSNHCAAT